MIVTVTSIASFKLCEFWESKNTAHHTPCDNPLTVVDCGNERLNLPQMQLATARSGDAQSKRVDRRSGRYSENFDTVVSLRNGGLPGDPCWIGDSIDVRWNIIDNAMT